jgi:hypothetical protein
MTEQYRGLDCHYSLTQIPDRRFDWIATDPNGEGEVLAYGATFAECKADIDRHIEDIDDE